MASADTNGPSTRTGPDIRHAPTISHGITSGRATPVSQAPHVRHVYPTHGCSGSHATRILTRQACTQWTASDQPPRLVTDVTYSRGGVGNREWGPPSDTQNNTPIDLIPIKLSWPASSAFTTNHTVAWDSHDQNPRARACAGKCISSTVSYCPSRVARVKMNMGTVVIVQNSLQSGHCQA